MSEESRVPPRKQYKRSWDQFRLMAQQVVGETSHSTQPGGSFVAAQPEPGVGDKRPAQDSLEGESGGPKKTCPSRPSRPSSESEGSLQISLAAFNTAGIRETTNQGDFTPPDMEGLEALHGTITPDARARSSTKAGPHEDEQSLPVAWEEEILAYRQRMEQPLEAPPDAQRLAELTKRYRLGGAYIHAFGIGHVQSVVRIGEDPNLRGNPRELNMSHVDNLHAVFSVPGSLRDHESPIYLMLPRELVAPDLLEEMSKADPHDPAADMPRLVLRHDHTAEMRELEEQLLSQIKDKRWMSEGELRVAAERLDTLRTESPLATLLNGHHRIRAIIRLGDSIQENHNQLILSVRRQSINQEDMRAEMKEISQRAKSTVYRVEVFDSTMPQELFNWLVRNEDPRPQMGMGAGEKAWWTASRWDVYMRNARQEGAQSRDHAADKAFSSWCKDIGIGVARAVSGNQTSSIGGKTAKSDAHRKGDWAGTDVVSRLFTNACTMEMVMDTRSAMTIYNHVLRRTTAVYMLQDTGALLAGRFWIACRIFLKIFNVAKGRGLDEAVRYLDSTPKLTSVGEQEAITHWNALHSHPQNTPEYMAFYDAELQNEFDDLYESLLNEYELSLDIDWDHDETRNRVRTVFETLGKRLQTRQPEWCCRVGVSMRLYARLPVACTDDSSQGPQFCSTSALPAKRWLERLASERHHFNFDGETLGILELLLDKFLPIWTIGAKTVGTSVNVHNWYGRSRGFHQIVMRLFQAEKLGSIDLRLDRANILIADPRLRGALRYVNADLAGQFRDLMRRCCVLRSHPLDYPFIDTIPPLEIQRAGGKQALLNEIAQARSSLKGLIFGSKHLSPERYDQELRRSYPTFFERIPLDYWSKFDPSAWVLGWNTHTTKRYRDVNSVVNWGFFTAHVEPLLQQLISRAEGRHLVTTVLYVSKANGQGAWWGDMCLLGTQGLGSADAQILEQELFGSDPDDDENGDIVTQEDGVQKELLALEDESDELPDEDEDGQESAVDGEVRIKRRDYETNTVIAGQSASNAALRPLQISSPQASLAPSPSSSGPELASDSDRWATGTQLAASSRLRAPSSPLPHMHASLQSQPEAPRPDSNTRESSPSGPVLATDKYSVSVDASGVKAHPTPCLAPDEPRTDLEQGVPAWRYVLQRNPAHLMTPPVAPSRTLDFVLGCGLFERPSDSEAIRQTIERNANSLENVVLRINSERQKLRQSVAVAARHCVDAAYGGHFAQVGLAPMMIFYKDIFVACVARVLREELDMTEAESINEAMALAVSDGLYDTDIGCFDNGQGNVSVDLAQTFARGHQDQLRDGEYIPLGTVTGCQEDRDVISSLMQWFHPARGAGRTERESAVRGMEGALLQLSRRKAVKNATPVFLSIVSKPSVACVSISSQIDDDLPSLDEVHKKWGFGEWAPPRLQITQQPQVSSLSTGAFTDQHRKWSSPREDMTPLGTRALEVAKQAQSHWHSAQTTDSLAYQLWQASPLQFPHSSPPGPTSGTSSSPSRKFPVSPDPQTLVRGAGKSLHSASGETVSPPINDASGDSVTSTVPFVPEQADPTVSSPARRKSTHRTSGLKVQKFGP